MLRTEAPAGDRPTPPRDARSLALLLINRFGERAVSYTAHQSLKAKARGDVLNAVRWRRIGEVTRILLRSDVDSAVAP